MNRRLWPAVTSAARQNLVPGLFLWSLALGLLVAHGWWPAAAGFFSAVAALKKEQGIIFSLVSTALCGGLLPCAILFITGRITRSRLPAALSFFLLYWAIKGLEVDAFYRLQAWCYGDGADPLTLVKKVLTDQLLYNPFWAVWSNVLAFAWYDCEFSFVRLRRERLNRELVTLTIPVVLLSTWIVWIPAVAVIYSLPADLQVPLFNIVLAFWVLMLCVFTKRED